MEQINSVNSGIKPVIMSSEELKALLYLTIRGDIRLPGVVQEKSASVETPHEIDLKA